MRWTNVQNFDEGGGHVMTTETNKAIVRRFFEDAWNQNKISDLEGYIAADNRHHFGTTIGTHGPNELRAMIKNWRGGLPDFQYHIEDMIAEDDRVVTRVRFTGTHMGTFEVASRTLVPSNLKLDEAEILITRIAGGKIVESWATWDRLSVLEQLGAIAKPTQVS
jgi:predicted ester cyclase